MTVKGARTVEVMGAGVACVVYPLGKISIKFKIKLVLFQLTSIYH